MHSDSILTTALCKSSSYRMSHFYSHA